MKKRIGLWLSLVSVIALGWAVAGCGAAGPTDTTTTSLAATTTTAAATTTTASAATTTTTTTTSTTTTTLLVPTGIADDTFGNNGAVTAENVVGGGPGGRDWGYGLAVDPAGKILIAGYGDSPSDFDIFVLRYTSSGDPDTSFGMNGKAVFSHAGYDDISAMAVDSSGNIFLAGEISGSANYDMAILKYSPTGGLDPSFGGTGIVTYDAGNDENASAIAVDTSGNIYVAGSSYGTNEAWLFKYDSLGNLVTGFGSNGKAVYFGGHSDYMNAIVIDTNGKIVVGGGSNNGTNGDMSVWRYDPDSGALDTSFGSGGKATYNGGGNEWGKSMTIDEAGNILLLGNNAANNFILCRFTDTGALDTIFGGGDGVVIYGSGEVYGNAVTHAYSGKILVAGYKGIGNWKATLWRFNSDDGTLDTTFNGQGYISSTLTAGDQDERGEAVVTDSLGRYLMGGFTASPSTSADTAIWRFK